MYTRQVSLCFPGGMRWYVSLEVTRRHCVYNTYVDDVQQESLRITAQQVAQVCDTLEQAGDTSRLARFLWSLPTDARSTAAFNQFEPVLRARALVAFHGGHFHHLYRILTTYRFARTLHTSATRVLRLSKLYNSPCMASPAGQTNQRGLGLSGSIHEKPILVFLNLSNAVLKALRLVAPTICWSSMFHPLVIVAFCTGKTVDHAPLRLEFLAGPQIGRHFLYAKMMERS